MLFRLRIVGVAAATLFVCSVSFGSIGGYLWAEPATVSHEVVSWNEDGTVEASVSMVLPSEFRDADGSGMAWVVCGVPALCHKAPISIESSEVSGVVGSFSMPLGTGDNPLTVTVTAQDANGEQIKHKTEEYVAYVPLPQPLEVEFLGYSITDLKDDGTAQGVLELSVEHPDEWPVSFFSVTAKCTNGFECGGYMIVRPGWFDDENPGSPRQSYEAHLVHIYVNRLAQGTQELSVELRDVSSPRPYLQWQGPPRVIRLEDISVSVPIAQSPDVNFLDSEVTGYNDDHTANVLLELLIKRRDGWPITSIVGTFSCNGEVDCEYERVIRPGWADGSDSAEKVSHVWLHGVPPGDVNISTTFEAVNEDWTGPQRLTILDEVVFTVPQQREFDVQWRVDSVETDGYYMDGSGNVNLSLSARNIGIGDRFQGEISALCIVDAVGADVAQCHQFEPALELNLSDEKILVLLPPLKLPQGESTIRIEAGAASGETSVHVQERAVGISRDLWDCFYETKVASGETCGGFNQPVVQKWALKSLNVYREGDPLYIEIFDDVLDTISEITGIQYVIVDHVALAHVEAYVGHEGHPSALRIFGEGCAYGPGCAFHFQNPDAPHELVGARLSVGKRQPQWRDTSITLEEEIRFTTLHEALHALIPIGHDSRPFSPSLVEKPSYIRKSDQQIFRMIYTSGVEPGMSFDELLEYVVFDDETIDYKPGANPPDIQISKAIRRFYDAGSINLKLTGMDVRGIVKDPGPTLDVQYSGFDESSSQMVRFWSRSWSSIILGYDAESWSSAGGRWTMSSDHRGRARSYRGHVKFDFILADPVRLLRYHMFSGDSLEFTTRDDGALVLQSTPSTGDGGWPRPTVEVAFDPENDEMRSYVIEWQFEPDSSYRYRIEAEVVSYGEEFEIPDEVREKSEFLSQFKGNAKVKTDGEIHDAS